VELRRLRAQIIPWDVRALADDLKQVHFQMLKQRGVFSGTSRVGSWHVSVSLARRLQTMGVAGFMGSPVPEMGSPGVIPGPAKLTPVNWFTIGAPVISNLVGLMFITLMAFLPPIGGNTTNQVAEYAMWSVQGAFTISECLANIGFPRGVFYFPSCIIDLLFFGIEVLWVVLDPNGVDGPSPSPSPTPSPSPSPTPSPSRSPGPIVVQCANYTQWPAIANSICGNCFALVPSAPYGGRCNAFCESFGHTCILAAEEVNESCNIQARFDCDEVVPNTSDMLCECVTTGPIETDVCDPYSNWPSIDNKVCGNCEAIPRLGNVLSCDDYCGSFEHSCVRARSAVNNMCDATSVRTRNCSDVGGFQELICQCQFQGGVSPNTLFCAGYSQWPMIDALACGNCNAVVSRNRRGDDLPPFGSCQDYCRSFNHTCTLAQRGNNCFEPFPDVNCTEPFQENETMLCECIIFENPIVR